MFTVYKHTSPVGKVYIGITSLTPKRRWQNGENYKSSIHFYNAIKKYGWENFTHEILYEGLTKDDAEKYEIELIKYYKSNNPQYGYNIEGGGKVAIPSQETRQKISKALKGRKGISRPHTEEEKEKIRKKMLGRPSPMKGKHQSIETRKKTSKAIRCKTTGMEYYSIKEAERQTGANHSNISKCLQGIYKQINGLEFEYV